MVYKEVRETIWEDKRNRLIRIIKTTRKGDDGYLRVLVEVGDANMLIWNRIDITSFFLDMAKIFNKRSGKRK